MSKYDSRINNLERRAYKLYAKINVFVSIEDLSLIRDYYKSLLDDSNATPEEIQKFFTRLEELEKEFLQDKSINFSEKFLTLAEENDLTFDAFDAFYYHSAIRNCNVFPNGRWLPKKYIETTLQQLKTAKEYFNKEGVSKNSF